MTCIQLEPGGPVVCDLRSIQRTSTRYICLGPNDGELAGIMAMDESTSRY